MLRLNMIVFIKRVFKETAFRPSGVHPARQRTRMSFAGKAKEGES
jgi:hypothetical protein